MIVSKINQGNKALGFIDYRVRHEKYRGAPSSEHNRYEMKSLKSRKLAVSSIK